MIMMICDNEKDKLIIININTININTINISLKHMCLCERESKRIANYKEK